jgi:YbbR domain-containing protein
VQHFGIKIVDYSPKEVTVDMDVLVVRQIPVKAALIGEMAGGAALLSQMVTPSHINVKGAKEYLKSITHISTRPIDLTTVTGPGEWKVPIEIDDQRIILDDATAKEVSVKLDIVAAKMERRNFDIPIRFISNGQNFHTNTQNVTVNYSYPNSLSAEDMEKGIRALVEVPEKSGVHKINVTVNLPEGLQLNKVYPDVITVKIDKRSSKR